MAVDIFKTLCWSLIVVDATCMLKEVDFISYRDLKVSKKFLIDE